MQQDVAPIKQACLPLTLTKTKTMTMTMTMTMTNKEVGEEVGDVAGCGSN